jgi:hypothetical protein
VQHPIRRCRAQLFFVHDNGTGGTAYIENAAVDGFEMSFS